MVSKFHSFFFFFNQTLLILSILLLGKGFDLFFKREKNKEYEQNIYIKHMETVILVVAFITLYWEWHYFFQIDFNKVSFSEIAKDDLTQIFLIGCFFILFGLLEKWLVRKSKGELKRSGLISYLEVLKQEKYKVILNFWVIAGLILIGIWLLLFMQVR